MNPYKEALTTCQNRQKQEEIWKAQALSANRELKRHRLKKDKELWKETKMAKWREYLANLPDKQLHKRLLLQIKRISTYRLLKGRTSLKIRRFSKIVRAYTQGKEKNSRLRRSGKFIWIQITEAFKTAIVRRKMEGITMTRALGLEPNDPRDTRICHWCPGCILMSAYNGLKKEYGRDKFTEIFGEELTCPPRSNEGLADIRCAVCRGRQQQNIRQPTKKHGEKKNCARLQCWNNTTYLHVWHKAATLALLKWDKNSFREAAEQYPGQERSQELLIVHQVQVYQDRGNMKNDERHELDTLWDIAKFRGLLDDQRPSDSLQRRPSAPQALQQVSDEPGRRPTRFGSNIPKCFTSFGENIAKLDFT